MYFFFERRQPPFTSAPSYLGQMLDTHYTLRLRLLLHRQSRVRLGSAEIIRNDLW